MSALSRNDSADEGPDADGRRFLAGPISNSEAVSLQVRVDVSPPATNTSASGCDTRHNDQQNQRHHHTVLDRSDTTLAVQKPHQCATHFHSRLTIDQDCGYSLDETTAVAAPQPMQSANPAAIRRDCHQLIQAYYLNGLRHFGGRIRPWPNRR